MTEVVSVTSPAPRVGYLRTVGADRWKTDGSWPTQQVLDLITGRMHRVAEPMYLGALSLYVKHSLERTQMAVDELEHRGTVRLLTIVEKQTMKFDSRANVYVLTELPHPAKAKW